jgi:hypothetical protein
MREPGWGRTWRTSSFDAAGVGSLEKKAGVVDDTRVLDHAGILFDGPPGIAGLSFVIVIRQI